MNGLDAPAIGGELSWALHHLATAAAEMDVAIARRLTLPPGDYLALKHLVVSAEPPGPVELGRVLGMTSGAATGLVDRLERAGYVRRHPHRRDRRRQGVSVTPLARERLVAELQPLVEDIDDVVASLTADQRRTVTEVLNSLAELHRQHAHRPGP